jgi:hypothetical protein
MVTDILTPEAKYAAPLATQCEKITLNGRCYVPHFTPALYTAPVRRGEIASVFAAAVVTRHGAENPEI